MLNRRFLSLFTAVTLAAAASIEACTAEERDFGGSGAGEPTTTSATTGVPDCTQPEQCFDGVDNDCNGATDCADAACSEGAICVDKPSNFSLGVLVGLKEPCPEGFQAGETPIYRGLTGGDCAGCDCKANPIGCKADFWYYTTASACTNDANLTDGTFYGEIGTDCTPDPVNGGLDFQGARISAFKVSQTCDTTGTAIPTPASWQETKKFCQATGVGVGCDAGKACVPKGEPKSQCALSTGSATCEGYAAQQNDWFTGYKDSRSCSSCSCVASGGNCDNMALYLGNDYSCDTGNDIYIKEGTKWCGYRYSPEARLKGNAKDPTCAVTTKLSGSLDPAGQSTLCCLE